jgi:hypothetical protein
MKVTVSPLNVLQLLLTMSLVAFPLIGSDWPSTAMYMQIATAVASGVLGTVSIYAPPMLPSSVGVALLGTTGVQGIHILQGTIGAVVSTVAGITAANPTLAPVAHYVSSIGGVLMGVLGVVSPKALVGPIAAMRILRARRGPPLEIK